MKKTNLFQTILFGVNRLVFQTFGPEDYPVSGRLEAPTPVQADEIEAQEQAAGRKTPGELVRAAEAVGQSGKKVVERQEEALAKAKEMLDDIANAKFNRTKEFLNAHGIDEQDFVDYLKTQYLDPRIAHPTNAQIVQATKDWQEAVGFKGTAVDGVVGKNTYAKMNTVPNLIVALKESSEKKPLFETMVEKGTMYRYRDAKGQVERAFLKENTPAVVLKETSYEYTAKITMNGKEIVVAIPKGLAGKRVALSPMPTGLGVRETSEPKRTTVSGERSETTAPSLFEEESEFLRGQLKKSKKRF